jgi:hypothetical protein
VRCPTKGELRILLKAASILNEIIEGRYVSFDEQAPDHDGGEAERKIARQLTNLVEGYFRTEKETGTELVDEPKPIDNELVNDIFSTATHRIHHVETCPQSDRTGMCTCGVSDIYRNLSTILMFGAEGGYDMTKASKKYLQEQLAAEEEAAKGETPTWHGLVRQEAKKAPAWSGFYVNKAFADYVLYEHTGFPEFWNSEDGATPEECCRTQVRKFFEKHTPLREAHSDDSSVKP